MYPVGALRVCPCIADRDRHTDAPRIVLQVNPQVRGAASPRRPVAAAADALERELLANEPRDDVNCKMANASSS